MRRRTAAACGGRYKLLRLLERSPRVEDRVRNAIRDCVGRESDLLAKQRRLAVRHVPVGEAEAKEPDVRGEVAVQEVLADRGAEAAREHVLLDRDQDVVIRDERLDQLLVEGLREA